MVVDVDGTAYRIVFHKEHTLKSLGDKWSKHYDCLDTYCLLQVRYEDNWELFAEATAKQNPMDRYSKVKGKQLALARALKAGGLDREVRRVFWDAFVREFMQGRHAR
jgi:hypothetical protein